MSTPSESDRHLDENLRQLHASRAAPWDTELLAAIYLELMPTAEIRASLQGSISWDLAMSFASEAVLTALTCLREGTLEYRSAAQFRGYVGTIAHNLALNEIRRRWYQIVSLDSTADHAAPEIAAPLDLIKHVEEREWIKDHLQVAQLTDDEHSVMVLTIIHGYKPTEIATLLHMTAPHVSRLLWKAKQKIRQHWHEAES